MYNLDTLNNADETDISNHHAFTPPTNQHAMVVSCQQITKDLLLKLLNNEIYAIRVPGHYAEEACKVVTKNFLNSNLIENYTNATNIGRVGMAFYEVQEDPVMLGKYYRLAKVNNVLIKKTFFPYVSPIDMLMIDLNKIWNAGCTLENLHGENMFVGLLRVLDEDTPIHPHQDLLRRDAKTAINAYTQITQLAANIYLNMPEIGGELQLWKDGCNDEEYKRLLTPGDYYVERSKIEEPLLTIKPQAGELVLFNPTKYHAVTAGKGAKRVSVSCFIGYRGEYNPLTLWS
jgi:hypothetical protein